MKRRKLALLLAACLALGGCAAVRDPLPESTIIPGTDPVLPAVNEEGRRIREEATLWFRFLDEPYLAPETRAIVQLTGQSYEMALLSALFSGPGTQYVELNSLFPEGTRVLSVSRQGRALLVTVSREFLNSLPDEPEDWQSDAAWRIEMPLRRRLAMQSLVATITENCDVDEVIVLLEQNADQATSSRLPRSWFLDENSDGLTGPQTRDDSCLLTPGVAGEAIMTRWLERDWQRLYLYVSSTDAISGEDRPAYRDFVTAMQDLPPLMAFACTGCSVSMDGLETTLSVQAQIRQANGQMRSLEARILRLRRDSGLWKIGMSSLISWLEE